MKVKKVLFSNGSVSIETDSMTNIVKGATVIKVEEVKDDLDGAILAESKRTKKLKSLKDNLKEVQK